MYLKDKGELPGNGYTDWAMFHYLYPDVRATRGRDSDIWKLAKKAIGEAQTQIGFNGVYVLGLDVDVGKLAELEGAVTRHICACPTPSRPSGSNTSTGNGRI